MLLIFRLHRADFIVIPSIQEPEQSRVLFVFMLKSSFYELKYLSGIVQVGHNFKYSVINGSN